MNRNNVNYQYDAVGNRQAVTDNSVPTLYTANNLNQYTVAARGGTRIKGVRCEPLHSHPKLRTKHQSKRKA